MNTQQAFALMLLLLAVTPILYIGGLLALKVLLILALSRDNEERRAALMGVLAGALSRR